ncbi:MAG: hypothetical protein OHK0057_11930 [Thermoflexibacter sp.]
MYENNSFEKICIVAIQPVLPLCCFGTQMIQILTDLAQIRCFYKKILVFAKGSKVYLKNK